MSATLMAGGAPSEFKVVIVNHTSTSYASVAPVVVIEGGPARSAPGTLQRYDPKSRSWKDAFMPTGTGVTPNDVSSPAFALPAGATVTVRFRISADPGMPSQHDSGSVYAVKVPEYTTSGINDQTQLATSGIGVQIAAK